MRYDEHKPERKLLNSEINFSNALLGNLPRKKGETPMTDNGLQEQAALLIDTANCRNVDFTQLLDLARKGGELAVTRAYGNFANSRDLSEAAQQLFLLGVQLIHCPAWPNGSGGMKSTADEVLMRDTHTLLFTEQSLSRFVIASGDGHFIPLVCEIKRQGRKAIVMANRQQISDMLKQAADEYVPLAPMASFIPPEIFQALVRATCSLQKAQSRSATYPGQVKQAMIKSLGEFDEKQYRDRKNRPFKKFTEFLKEAEVRGHVHLVRQGNSFLVTTTSEKAQAA